MIETNLLLKFYENIETQEGQIKACQEDIKEAFAAFAKNNGIAVKALKRDYKNYKEYQKNPDEFVEVDLEADALTQLWVPAYKDKGGQ